MDKETKSTFATEAVKQVSMQCATTTMPIIYTFHMLCSIDLFPLSTLRGAFLGFESVRY